MEEAEGREVGAGRTEGRGVRREEGKSRRGEREERREEGGGRIEAMLGAKVVRHLSKC